MRAKSLGRRVAVTWPFQKRCSSAILASSQSHHVPFLPTRSDEVAGRDRTVVDDPLVHLLDEAGAPLAQRPVAPPLVIAGHLPAMEVIVGHVDVRRLVHPVLEHLAGLGGIGDHGARVRAESGEQRQLLAAHQDVDRVDLDQTHPIEHAAEVTTIDAPLRARVGEALRGERDAARRRQRDLLGGHRAQSATVMVTELITTSVRGRSLRSVSTRCIASTISRPFTT